MRIAEFCTATGLSRDTVRFYIKRGLLTPEINTGNGYADFDAAQVERALVIKTSQALGFTLKEIATLSAEWQAVGNDVQWQLKLMRERLAGLDAQAQKLRSLRRYFASKIRWLEAGSDAPYPPLPKSLRVDSGSACVPAKARPRTRHSRPGS